MTVRNISIEAYHKHMDSGKAMVQWMKIYEYLNLVQANRTRAEIAYTMNLRDSSVCGRVKELLDADVIVEYERVKCTVTGQQAHPVGINPEPHQGELL